MAAKKQTDCSSIDNQQTRAHTKHIAQALAISYTLLIAYVIYLSSIGLRGPVFKIVHVIPFGDHGAHFLLVGLLALLIGISNHWKELRVCSVTMLSSSWVLLIVMGIEEAMQNFLIHRTADVCDLLGNFLGVIVFDYLARYIHSRSLISKHET